MGALSKIPEDDWAEQGILITLLSLEVMKHRYIISGCFALASWSIHDRILLAFDPRDHTDQ